MRGLIANLDIFFTYLRLDATDCKLFFENFEVAHSGVHGPGPQGGPWTWSTGWSMDPGPCFVYVRLTMTHSAAQ